MANFTINSLDQGVIADTDNFIKSDSSGALTKVTPADIANKINGNTSISAIGNGTVTGAISALNGKHVTRDLVSNVTANTELGFTVQQLYYKANGNVRQFYAQIRTTNDIAIFSQLFTGLDSAAPLPLFIWDGAVFDVETTKILCQTVLTANKTYKISFIYIV